MIAGDHNITPIRYGAGEDNAKWDDPNDQEYKIPADLYFADFTGDWNVDNDVQLGEPNEDSTDCNPEIFVGRLPISNNQEIANWIEKVLLYEQNPGDGDNSYLMNAFWIRGEGVSVSPNTVKTHCPPSFNHVVWDYYNNDFNSGAEVVSEMSDHYGLLNWHCHGGTNLFRVKAKDASNRYVLTEDDDPESDQPGDGLDNMTNDRLYSIVYSICCGIAAFDDYHPHGDWYMGESMAEGFTNMFGHICGPNLLGNTRNGLQISSPALQKEFYDLLTTGTQDPGSGESYFHLGVSELVSKQNYNSHYLRYSHNLFGCPETQIWTDTPSEFTNVSITDNGTSITVNSGVSGCDICVSSGNNGADYHLLASDVSSYTFTTDVRPLYITVTKHNFIPYTAVTGGTFTSAETWFGNLHALGSVTFDGNSTLEVLPGTKVLFDSKYNLCIKAGSKIIAEGTESSPVYFTSTDGTSRESWGTLYVYSSDNVFKWCIVEYGDWGLKLYGNPSPASNNIVENCTFRTNDQGLRMEKNEVDVISCNIYDNRHNVVTMYNTQIDMEGTRIYNGGRDGIYCSSADLLNIYGSVIENNGNGGTSTRNGIYSGYADVINIGRLSYPYWYGYNTIRNNYNDEIYSHYGNSQVEILYNSIHDNSGYEVYNYSGNPEIWAMLCWWGEFPPDVSQFYGAVDVSDELEFQPSWEGQTFSGGLSKSVAVSGIRRSPEEHIAHLKNLIISESKTRRADSALVALYSIIRTDYVNNRYQERNHFYDFLTQLQANYSEYPVGQRALQYLII